MAQRREFEAQRQEVGATAAQVDKLQDLAEPLLEVAALQRLRLTTQLGDPRKVA